MPETGPTRPDVPQVQDKRIRIPGLLPRNAQHRFLAGIALLMMAIIALSGKNPPKERAASGPAPTPAPVDPNQGRIREYQARIEEQARKLAAEEARLAQTKQALGQPTGQAGLPGGPEVPGGTAAFEARSARASGAAYPPYGAEMAARATPERDREKREAQALFASNIALSYRQAAASPREPAEWAVAGAAKAPASSVVASESAKSEAAPSDRPLAGSTADRESLQRAEGNRHRLFEGTLIETVLTNRLDSSLSGPIDCLVTTNIYSHDGQHLLIPQGSRVLGEVRKLETMGEQRLAVSFHRLVMPDGFSVDLNKFQGLNQIGETGLRDQVNHHYMQIFGASLAIGAIAGLSQANTRYGLDASAADAYRQGVATSVSQSSLRILDRYLNVPPTFTIREGHRVKIYLSQDLVLPAYEAHQMPSNL